MGNEIDIRKDGVVSLTENHDLGDLIKPLTKEIYLFDSFVAGTTHLADPSVLDSVKEGDKLTLRRENNKFDNNAVMLLSPDDRKLGYIPEKDNIIFSRLMDAGKLLTARITNIEIKGTFHQISIGIYLVDF